MLGLTPKDSDKIISSYSQANAAYLPQNKLYLTFKSVISTNRI